MSTTGVMHCLADEYFEIYFQLHVGSLRLKHEEQFGNTEDGVSYLHYPFLVTSVLRKKPCLQKASARQIKLLSVSSV